MAPKPAAKKATGKPATNNKSAAASRAQQAAQHQGRAAAPARPNANQQTTRQQEKVRASVPAEVKHPNLPQNFGTSANLPAFMRGDVGMGKENISREDMETPRLKLIQGISPELETYDALRAGNFFHTASEMIIDESFLAVPIFMERRYILWRPRQSGGGILARADDGVHWSPSSGEFTVQLDKIHGGQTVSWRLAPTVAESGLANWGTMNPNDSQSPPAATLMYNFVLAFPEMPDMMPAVLTFQRSSIKQGRRFNSKLKTNPNPIFGMVFRFASFQDTNNAGQDFYNVSVTGEGIVEDEKLYNYYKELHMSFREQGLTIRDIEGLQEDGGDFNDNGEDGDPNGRKY